MITSFIYKSGINLYNILPFKRAICKVLRWSGIPNSKFYTDIRFKGTFTTKAEENKIVTIINHGGNHENEIFWKGLAGEKCYENDTLWLWQLLSKNANVIVDVGANIGVYSLAAKAQNAQARVIAFEPAKRTIKYLEENIAANSFDIKTENIALSNNIGKVTFYDTIKDHQTSASLNPAKEKNRKLHEIFEYEVQTNTFDNYLDENNIKKVDLIKIDVEMYEPEVLSGMRNIIKTSSPSLIVEVLNNDLGIRVMEILREYGYSCFSLTAYKKMQQVSVIDVIPEKWNYFFCQANVAEKLAPYIID